MNLNETFSPSMPRWLQVYLIRTVQDIATDKQVKKYRDMGYDLQRFAEPRKRKYRDESIYNPPTISKFLLDGKLDLSKATFVEVPVPEDSNSPLFSKKDDFNKESDFLHKLFFYHLMWEDKNSGLPHELVWARGINDNELLEDTSAKRLGSLPNSKNVFCSLTEHICYLDLVDPANFLDPLDLKNRSEYHTFSNLDSLQKLSDKEVRDAIMQKRMEPNSVFYADGHAYTTDASGYPSKLVLELLNNVHSSLARARYVYKQLPTSIKHSREACSEILEILTEINKELSVGAELLAKNLDRNYINQLGNALDHIDALTKRCNLVILILYRLNKLSKSECREFIDWILSYTYDYRTAMSLRRGVTTYSDDYTFYASVTNLLSDDDLKLCNTLYKIDSLQAQLEEIKKLITGLTYSYV